MKALIMPIGLTGSLCGVLLMTIVPSKALGFEHAHFLNHPVIHCSEGTENGIKVEIHRAPRMSNTFPLMAPPSFIAYVVEENTSAGTELLGEYLVHQYGATRAGDPTIYMTENFRMDADLTITQAQGRVPAELQLLTEDGQWIETTVYCTF